MESTVGSISLGKNNGHSVRDMQEKAKCTYCRPRIVYVSLVSILAICTVLGISVVYRYHVICESETMFRHHKRVLSKCSDGNGSFVGEKHHKLWWDKNREYWFCGMNTSEISLIEFKKVQIPLLFNSNIKTTPALSTAMNASLRDGRETEFYKNTNMVVIAIQGIPPNTLSPDKLGVVPIDGLAVDIDFTFTG